MIHATGQVVLSCVPPPYLMVREAWTMSYGGAVQVEPALTPD